MIVFLIILAAIVLLAAVLVTRALMFRPASQEYRQTEPAEFDGKGAVESLAQLIRCRTVSYPDREKEDEAEFEKLEKLLSQLYPNVFRHCTFERLPGRALLFRWKGRRDEAPSVMMAHYDVVPADAEKWEKPPFGAVVEDGVMWGRGTLDTKATFNGALYAADTLIARDFVPENDVYLAFSGGEEVSGDGAANIVAHFREKGISPALVLDEGGAVVQGVFPGVKEPCGLIGIAEKGVLNARFTSVSEGGHASAPKSHTPLGRVARACTRIEKRPFPMHITKPAAEMLDTLGRYSTFLYRLIFANLWLFRGVLDVFCRKTGGEINALVRTTVAFTQASGSAAVNVIPTQASMAANLRLNPMDSIDSALKRLRRTAGDDRVDVSAFGGTEPSAVSETGCEAWNRVASAVAGTWPGCIVSPYLMVQCSDSRHYGEISRHVYRFSAMDLTSEERATIHGNNERIRIESVKKAVEFYIKLLRMC